MSRKVLFGSALALGLCLIAGAALANTMAASKGMHPMSAQTFAKTAAEGGMAEVDLGNLAVERAKNADVKSFGQRMVDDHSKANDELKSLAAQKNWTLPTSIDAKHRALKTRLSKLHDEAFDREYMREMVKDHDHDVAMFKRYAQHGGDADLKAWANKTLPTLEEHQSMAKSTAKGVGASMASLHHQGH